MLVASILFSLGLNLQSSCLHVLLMKVEDMDVAFKGWKFLFLGKSRLKNELPSILKAYKY
ncbi:Glucomannan 4-beta-mannosyltransferase protein [Dioscorea alata]|uniref:Glucomannan 4-beta-mannosyltransferase protein n=1 Tax=Dioscorea alata TaxID=55571 RepID=A0ACB7UH87_DIOAL|nr:Glucomannan 4-beta-mannosyltransferase protein [Dioscorea alata]